MPKIKQFSVTFVNIEFITNPITLMIHITDIFKTVMNTSTAQNVAARFFLLTLCYVIKVSWLVAPTLIPVLHSGKGEKVLKIAHYY